MTYNGYFEFGGVELVNSARIQDYVNKIAPTIGLVNCEPCPGLARTLGHAVTEGAETRGALLSTRTNHQRNPRAANGLATGFGSYDSTTIPVPGATIYSSAGTPTAARINLATNPNPAAPGGSAAWNFQNGTGEVTALTYVTGATDGPTPEITNYQRRTVTTAKSGGVSGWFYREPAGVAIAGAAGDVRRLAIWVRYTPAATMSGSLSMRSGVTNVGLASLTASIPANTWYLATADVTATATYDGAQLFAAISTALPVGGTYDVAVAHVEDSRTWAGDVFWGDQAGQTRVGDVAVTHAYSGTAMASASERRIGFTPGATFGEDAPTFARRVTRSLKPGTQATGFASPNTTYHAAVTGVAGDVVTMVVRHRWSGTGPTPSFWLRVRLYTAGGTFIPASESIGTTYPSPSGTIVEHVVQVTATAAFGYVGYSLFTNDALSIESVDDVGAIRTFLNTPPPYLYFDGATADTPALDHAWVGATNNSASTLSTYATFFPVTDNSYVDPRTDVAPWYDPGRSASADFLGMYPLDVAGIDDSSREASPIDLLGNGTTMTRVRRGGREMRFETVLLSTSEEGLDHGLSWLESTLDASRCSDPNTDACNGQELKFFSSCPDKEPIVAADTVYNWDGTSPAAEAPLWATSGGALFKTTGHLNFAASQRGLGQVSRTLTNLVSGQWYLVAIKVGGFGRLTISVSDTTATLPRLSPSTGNTAYTHYVEFLARSSSEVLTITNTADPTLLTGDLEFKGLVVKRTRVGSIARTENFDPGTFSELARPFGVSPDAGASSRLDTRTFPNLGEASQDPLLLEAYPTTLFPVRWTRLAASTTAAAGSMTFFNISLGPMLAGTYRAHLTLNGSMFYGGSTSFTSVELVGPSGTASPPATVPGTGLAPVELVVDFVLNSDTDSAGLSLRRPSPGTGTTVLTGDYIEVVPVMFQIARISNQTAVPQPDTSVKYQRTLQNVVAFTGPTVVERMKLTCGYGARVTFGMMANDPRKYKAPRYLGRTQLYDTPGVLPNRCKNGQPYRYNYFTNPTFAIDLAGWTPAGTSSLPFTWSATRPTGQTGPDGLAAVGPGTARGGIGTAGQTLHLRTTVTIGSRGWYHLLFLTENPVGTRWTVAVGTSPGASDIALLTTIKTGSRQEYADVYIASPGVAVTRTVHVELRYPSTAVTGATTVVLDQMLWGEGRYRREDGWFMQGYQQSMPSWPPIVYAAARGLADYNDLTPWLLPDDPGTSVRCLKWPEPPRGTDTLSNCNGYPLSFESRKEILVPPGAMSSTGVVVPRVTITLPGTGTSTNGIPMIRMRWYRNPTGKPADLLDQCAFEAEQTLANVPVSTIIVVDGLRRTVKASSINPIMMPDRAIFTDMDLTFTAYGPDMTGVAWPELSCGEQYTLVVEAYDGISGPYIGGSTLDLELVAVS